MSLDSVPTGAKGGDSFGLSVVIIVPGGVRVAGLPPLVPGSGMLGPDSGAVRAGHAHPFQVYLVK